LHCPFGYTIKKLGIQFREITQKDQDFLAANSSLDLDEINLSEYRIFSIKGYDAGFIKISKLFVEEIYYASHFEEQGLTKEIIESYYFY
jgi:hypothetical protein